MGRFVVIVLDGFGIGAMKDAKVVRPGDEVSSTLGSILKDYPDLYLPNLERLGLMNAYGHESLKMKFSTKAIFGKSELMHYGADTFMGHQEIMGTIPKKPDEKHFNDDIDKVINHLRHHNHKVEIRHNKDYPNLRYLVVDDYCTVADNIDSDLGMAINCTAPLDFMSFDKEIEIGKLVREIVTVNRVIVFGGTGNTMDDLYAAEEVKEGRFLGIVAAKSKSYVAGYECRHLGYGVNKDTQAPTILTNHDIPVTLIGKVADIVINDKGKSISCVPTAECLDLTINELKSMDHGFICTNVQETDLAGHSQNSKWYKELLEIADEKIGKIITLLHDDDILLIQADHGNDPDIGHNRHTRENVPLLIYKANSNPKDIGLRKTMSDVGATVCDYFKVEAPENGTSFLNIINE